MRRKDGRANNKISLRLKDVFETLEQRTRGKKWVNMSSSLHKNIARHGFWASTAFPLRQRGGSRVYICPFVFLCASVWLSTFNLSGGCAILILINSLLVKTLHFGLPHPSLCLAIPSLPPSLLYRHSLPPSLLRRHYPPSLPPSSPSLLLPPSSPFPPSLPPSPFPPSPLLPERGAALRRTQRGQVRAYFSRRSECGQRVHRISCSAAPPYCRPCFQIPRGVRVRRELRQRQEEKWYRH